ncbi:MAG: hypothetical protein J6W88_06450 [Bacteroidales bacterium]|nr:hypothetical protein [Bacteroidales bacterium]
MKKTLQILCFAALMLSLKYGAQAQFRQSIFLNGDLPVGGWAKSVSSNHTAVPLYNVDIAKDVTAGFGAGYRASYRFDVGVGMVAPFAQGDFWWNFTNNEWKDKYIQADAASPNYFNVTAMIGVSYLYDELWNDITPYGEFGIGADIFFITKEKSDNFLALHKTYAYKPSTDMAWMIGAGSYFGRHVSAGLYYYGLGKHTIKYTNSTVSSFSTVEEVAYKSNVETRTLGMLALRIGFHF